MDYPLDYFVDLFIGLIQSVPPEYLWVRRGGKGAVRFFVLLLQKKKLKVSDKKCELLNLESCKK